ncbi:hypothetical protein [Amycolatopsis lexingtonensis]|uniref:hypothetical protein n=1 Tax=Amycolatopsis lexingtonensis TaxID=218822 RepID=UPI003F7122C0
MLINATVFGGPKPNVRPALEWPVDQADPKEMAETINLLAQAEAISTEIKVKMAHPEWEQRDVDDEVKRIKAEKPAAPDPLTGGEPFGPPDPGQPQPPVSGEPPQRPPRFRSARARPAAPRCSRPCSTSGTSPPSA